MTTSHPTVELSWSAALSDDDFEFLGVPDDDLQSSWLHCSDIVRRAEHNGFDNVLLSSGFSYGLDATAFTAAVASLTTQIQLLMAVRLGELNVVKLARQIATLQQISSSRISINAISTELPGENLSNESKYRRTTEHIYALGELLAGNSVSIEGEFLQLNADPPRINQQGFGCPPIYFGGLSEPARDCAAACADVYLMLPDTTPKIANIILDLNRRAQRHGRTMKFGWRSNVIVRPTEREAREAARRLMSRLSPVGGDSSSQRGSDSTSTGVARFSELSSESDNEGYFERHLWTGLGQLRSGVTIVGDPDQVAQKLHELIDAGVSTFVLSGFPHLKECDLFAKYVLPQINHGRLAVTHAAASLQDLRG